MYNNKIEFFLIDFNNWKNRGSKTIEVVGDDDNGNEFWFISYVAKIDNVYFYKNGHYRFENGYWKFSTYKSMEFPTRRSAEMAMLNAYENTKSSLTKRRNSVVNEPKRVNQNNVKSNLFRILF